MQSHYIKTHSITMTSRELKALAVLAIHGMTYIQENKLDLPESVEFGEHIKDYQREFGE